MIYLDNAATTKPNALAISKAMEYNEELYYNPSALYRCGIKCNNAIKDAKAEILRFLGADSSFDVIFTSCGSESNNQAIFSCVKRGVFVTDKGEHASVYKSFLELKNKGQEVYFIDLNEDGSINLDKLYSLAKEKKIDFISLIHVNNETGAINDVNLIARTLKQINPKIVVHVDGVQAYLKIPYRLDNFIDLYSISAHKIGGLKGTGALIKKKSLHINPLIYGGGQENGLRSGTENVFGIKVFQFASQIKFNNLKNDYEKVMTIKDYFINNLDNSLFKIISGVNSSPYILSVSAVGVRGEVLMHTLENEDIIVGNGSACSSKNRYSRVIEACGYNNSVLDGVIRISFSPESSLEQAKIAANKLSFACKDLKGIMR
jgi:cysteine desulfurase